MANLAGVGGPQMSHSPLRIAIVNDYDVVVRGLAAMLAPYGETVQVVETLAGTPSSTLVDVVLYDSYGQGAVTEQLVRDMLTGCGARALVVFSWNTDQGLVEAAVEAGAGGYLEKSLSAPDLIDALTRIAGGEVVHPRPDVWMGPELGAWPGRTEGLTLRESEIIALITQGLSNDQVAARAFLSINTIKSYVRSSYRKMGVTNRSQAILWGVAHGFRPDSARLRRAAPKPEPIG